VNLPVFRISVHNATLLSAAYLAIATVLEGIRRIFNPRWAEKACLAMESFPARAIDLVGLLDPIKHAYAWGTISELQVRLLFGLATVVVIFLLAVGVGSGMWLFAKIVTRKEPAA
jgi:hypothetical protein